MTLQELLDLKPFDYILISLGNQNWNATSSILLNDLIAYFA
jgi:hypothetical protein